MGAIERELADGATASADVVATDAIAEHEAFTEEVLEAIGTRIDTLTARPEGETGPSWVRKESDPYDGTPRRYRVSVTTDQPADGAAVLQERVMELRADGSDDYRGRQYTRTSSVGENQSATMQTMGFYINHFSNSTRGIQVSDGGAEISWRKGMHYLWHPLEPTTTPDRRDTIRLILREGGALPRTGGTPRRVNAATA